MIGAYAAGRHSWLTILNPFGVGASTSLVPRCDMRLIPALFACATLLCASAALADSRVFIIANQPDGYGVDRCLANSEKCGAHAAAAYCQARAFAQATAYRRVDPDEVTGSVPKSAGTCPRGGCNEYIAITCRR